MRVRKTSRTGKEGGIMARLRMLVGSGIVAMTVAFAPSAWAQGPLDQTTYVTSSSPVELPGIALPAGTYIFRLPDPEGAHNVIQVLSQDRSQVYAMLMGVEQIRTRSAGGRVVAMFNEGRSASPPAMRTFFFADDPVGIEFIYPAQQAQRIAQSTHQPVLTADGRYVRG
jgi:hypothetical protein